MNDTITSQVALARFVIFLFLVPLANPSPSLACFAVCDLWNLSLHHPPLAQATIAHIWTVQLQLPEPLPCVYSGFLSVCSSPSPRESIRAAF